MKYKLEKCMHIVNDLMIYCTTLGATEYHVDFLPGETECSFVLKAKVESVSAEEIQSLKEALNQHRTMEVEELYWAINYDSDSPCEKVMLGMMLDQATAAYDGETLVITGVRKD